MKIEVRVDKSLDAERFLPQKAHEADAGFDIFCPADCVVPAKGSCVIDTLVGMAIPMGYVGMLKSKSGLNCKHGIRGEGVIDSGYTGNIVAKLYNDSDNDYHFHKGDKLIQIVIIKIPTVKLEIVDEFEETDRGNNGFGSTGR